MKNIVIFDLDGTLALVDHRRHFVQGPLKDWDSFNDACVYDEPNLQILGLFKNLADKIKDDDDRDVFDVRILSGRSDIVKDQTLIWLSVHSGFGMDWLDKILKMRPAGDSTPDEVLKRRWAEEIGVDRIAMVFDDRDKVVKMWRELGITCLQVAEGAF